MKSLFITACFFALLLTTITPRVSAKDKPNIILILADDLGYETLGCNGNDDHLTPNLDKLAATGMRFDNCHATPLCTPSRVQLMTGKYNNRNYIGFGLLKPDQKTFGHYMQEQGYKTCIAGKWQLYGNDIQIKLAGGLKGSMPQDCGFDNFCLWQVDQLGSRYKDPTVYTDDRKSVTLTGKFGDDVFESYIENFIEKNRTKPFFVYYPMCLTHDPFVPTPFSSDYANPVGGKKVDDPKYFKDMLKYLDYLTGRLFKKVEQLGLSKNTVILFMGDNGTSTRVTSRFRGGLRTGNKGYTNDRGTHVPFIVNWPGVVKPGSVNTSLVDFTDFLPTLLDIAGAKNNKVEPGDGLSIYNQLKGDSRKKRDWIFCYYNPNWDNFTPHTFVYNKDWKLYSTGEIYNLKNDPDELKPLTKTQLSADASKTIAQFEQVLHDKLNR